MKQGSFRNGSLLISATLLYIAFCEHGDSFVYNPYSLPLFVIGSIGLFGLIKQYIAVIKKLNKEKP